MVERKGAAAPSPGASAVCPACKGGGERETVRKIQRLVCTVVTQTPLAYTKADSRRFNNTPTTNSNPTLDQRPFPSLGWKTSITHGNPTLDRSELGWKGRDICRDSHHAMATKRNKVKTENLRRNSFSGSLIAETHHGVKHSADITRQSELDLRGRCLIAQPRKPEHPENYAKPPCWCFRNRAYRSHHLCLVSANKCAVWNKRHPSRSPASQGKVVFTLAKTLCCTAIYSRQS